MGEIQAHHTGWVIRARLLARSGTILPDGDDSDRVILLDTRFLSDPFASAKLQPSAGGCARLSRKRPFYKLLPVGWSARFQRKQICEG